MPLNPKKIDWFRRQLKTWSKHHLRDFPWRQTQDPYTILVAELVLQKTDAETAHPLYRQFIQKYPTLTDIANASVEEIEALLNPLGLHFRATRLYELAHQLLNHPVYKGRIPQTEEALLQLPGVGKYTARSLLANAFNRPLAVLDTNVARILERFFGIQGGRVKSRDPLLWNTAQEVAPKRKVGGWNLTLIDFGALVCTARNPRCQGCPLRRQCSYYRATLDREAIAEG